MEPNFLSLWSTMGVIARLVVIVLVLMSCASLAAAAERWWAIRRALEQSKRFLVEWRLRVESGNLGTASLAAREFPSSPVGRLVEAGTRAWTRASSRAAGEVSMSHAVRRSIVDTSVELRRGFGLVATVGSTAPFVGLFGTVVGIVNAFERMAATGQGGLATVSSGISEALVATALGILVAIPAVWLFNVLTQQAGRLVGAMESAGEELAEVVALAGDHAQHAATPRGLVGGDAA